jgi:ribosomal protein S18 acetylase RimI-like enzyme
VWSRLLFDDQRSTDLRRYLAKPSNTASGQHRLVRVTHDRDEVLAAIRHTGNDIYALADLDEPIWSMSRWWVDDTTSAYALCIDGFAPPVLYVNGVPASAPAFAALLGAVVHELPDMFYANVIVGAESALSNFDYSPVGTYQRMEVADIVEMPEHHEAQPVLSEQFEEMQAFFRDARAHEGEHVGEFFTEAMLATGFYRAMYRDGAIVAVAGVHVASRTMGVASIGNVAVHHRWRGQRLASTVTSAVVTALRDNNIGRIGLNVDITNTAAISTYERLGFTARYHFTEGPATRR